ncbi:MAG: RIP metalloprotease RseP [Bdellovibrionales bacterium]
MDISALLSTGFNFVVSLSLLLGLLIFVHELGHFAVARWCGVKVETFSIGFGKKIWQRTYGDTTYCLSIIPFGGYVKMFGEDINAEVSDADRAVSFAHKTVYQRIAIVIAGPIMNFLFAILVFGVIAMVGEEQPTSTVGNVVPQSYAWEKGIRAGDTIKSVDGNMVSTWQDYSRQMETKGNSPVELKVLKAGSQETTSLILKSKEIDNPNILSQVERIGSITGMEMLPYASLVSVTDEKSIAYSSGLRTNDIVKKINDIEISRWYELKRLFSLSSDTVKLEVVARGDKDAKPRTIEIIKNTELSGLSDYGIEDTQLIISKVMEGSAAAGAGLKEWDKIESINGELITRWQQLVDIIRNYNSEMGDLKIVVTREGTETTLAMAPKPTVQTDPITGKETTVYAIGVTTALAATSPVTTLVRTSNPVKAIGKGFNDSVQWSVTTLLSFWKLVSSEVSAKSIGGPIMIGQLASQSFQMGLAAFLKIMGIISINLFILNLLPLPVLDGGHLMFYLVELVRGKPVSIRVLEVAQTFGLILLLSLMVFATFNDISRSFGF